MKELFLKYACYNQWANARLLENLDDHASGLLDKETSSSFNSIRKTIMHIADAEYIWHVRLQGGTADKIPGQSGRGG